MCIRDRSRVGLELPQGWDVYWGWETGITQKELPLRDVAKGSPHPKNKHKEPKKDWVTGCTVIKGCFYMWNLPWKKKTSQTWELGFLTDSNPVYVPTPQVKLLWKSSSYMSLHLPWPQQCCFSLKLLEHVDNEVSAWSKGQASWALNGIKLFKTARDLYKLLSVTNWRTLWLYDLLV